MTHEEVHGETKSYHHKFQSTRKSLELIENVMKASSVEKKFGYLIWLKSGAGDLVNIEEEDMPSPTITIAQIEAMILSRQGNDDEDDDDNADNADDDVDQRDKLTAEELRKLKKKERLAAKSLKGTKVVEAGASVIAATARAVNQNINRGLYLIGQQGGTD